MLPLLLLLLYYRTKVFVVVVVLSIFSKKQNKPKSTTFLARIFDVTTSLLSAEHFIECETCCLILLLFVFHDIKLHLQFIYFLQCLKISK